MASVLIVSELQKGALRESSYELAAFAQKLAGSTGRDVKSLVMGSGVSGEAEALAGRGGGEVYLVEGDLFANYVAPSRQCAPPSKRAAPTWCSFRTHPRVGTQLRASPRLSMPPT